MEVGVLLCERLEILARLRYFGAAWKTDRM